MFNVGGGEIIVIALIALIFLGPQRLPDAARKAGKMMRDLRELSAGFQREVQQAFEEHGGAQAVQAADKLKTLSGGPLGPVRTGINAAVASVSSQARLAAPAEKKAVRKSTSAGAGSKAPAKRTTAKGSTTKSSAPKKAAAKKSAPTKRGPVKKTAPAKTSAPAKRAPARSTAKKQPLAERTTPVKKA